MTRTITLDVKDPELEQKLQGIQKEIEETAKKDLIKLGSILRRRSLFFFKRFLVKHNIKMHREHIPLFMDYLITKRIDLKDMEPEARKRLRDHLLKNQPEGLKTDDYIKYVESKPKPDPPVTCKECLWFMTSPPGDHDSCVRLGTKGSDAPCYGFNHN